MELQKISTFLSQVNGIDKSYRFIIYFLKIVSSYYSKKYGDKQPLVQRISAFTTPLSDTRMILRFFGIIPILQSLKDAKIPRNVSECIDLVQLLSLLVYYPAEHLYWLGAHKIFDIQDPDKWSRTSCQAWALYIILDIYQIYKQFENLEKKSEKEKKLSENVAFRNGLILQLISSLTDLPLAIHWSLPSYPLSDMTVGLLGFCSTIASSLFKWNKL